MLKRGYGATVEEWLMAAEYIVVVGQPQRDPVRARHPDLRDVHAQHAGPVGGAAAPPPDPPAGHRRPEPRDRQALAGRRRWRSAASRSGADGIMVEVHPTPDDALSDAEQQLTLDQFRDMMAAVVAGPRAWSRRCRGEPIAAGAVGERRRAVEALSGR